MTLTSSKYRRWAILLGPALLVSLGCAVYFGPQVRVYFEMRRVAGPPEMWKVPRPLDDTAISASAGTTLAYFGYKFEVPWVGIETELNEGRWVKVLFLNGQTVSFSNPDYFQNDVLQRAVWNVKVFLEGFNVEPTGTRYEHLKAALAMTPAQLSPLCSRRRFAKDLVYLETKSIWFGHSGSVEIFTVQSPTYKGFESRGIVLGGGASITLFDASDHKFDISVSRAKISAPVLTQPEINKIIQSFGPFTSPPPSHEANQALDCNPRPVGAIRPSWPKDLRGIKSSGVTLQYGVTTKGEVFNIKVVKSSGKKEVDQAAVLAVANTLYRPLPEACGQVEGTVSINLDF